MKKGIFNDPLSPKSKKSNAPFGGPSHLKAATGGDFMAPGDDYGVGIGPKYGTMKEGGDSAVPKKSFSKKVPRSLA